MSDTGYIPDEDDPIVAAAIADLATRAIARAATQEQEDIALVARDRDIVNKDRSVNTGEIISTAEPTNTISFTNLAGPADASHLTNLAGVDNPARLSNLANLVDTNTVASC